MGVVYVPGASQEKLEPMLTLLFPTYGKAKLHVPTFTSW